MFSRRHRRSGKQHARPVFSEALESRTLLSAVHPANVALGHVFSPDAIEHADNQTANITAMFTFSANVISTSSTQQVIQVVYSDATSTAQLIESSIPTSLLVTGPNGYSQQAAEQGPPDSGGGNTFTVYYNANSPGGFAAGAYTVTVPAGQVTDSDGDSNAQITAMFMVSATAAGSNPTAAASAQNITYATQAEAVVVTYSDTGSAVNGATVAASNISVTGPAGTLTVGSTSYQQNGNNVIATYNLTPPDPSGFWLASNDGAYTVTVNANSVFDGNNKGNTAGTGTFSIQIVAMTPPTVNISFSALAITSANQNEVITVTYSSAGGIIDTSTIASSNVQITGPNGINVTATLVNNNPPGGTVLATYVVNNPDFAGFWQASDNGTYTVEVAAGTVKDSFGNSNAQAGASFTVDVSALTTPIAYVTSTPSVIASATDIEVVTVIYAGGSTLNTSNISPSNIGVTGPDGQGLAVTLGNMTGSGNQITQTYDVTAPDPGGLWHSADNGIYNVVVDGNVVTDANGKDNAPSSGAGFSVNIPDVNSRTPTISANAITANAQQALVVVTFGTPTGVIDPSTITASDITVTSPGGTKLTVGVQSTSTNGPAAVGTFTVSSPHGVWLQSDSGAYEISIAPNVVKDTSGNGNTAGFGTLTVNAPAITTPFEVFSVPNVTAVNQAFEVFSVVYASSSQIHVAMPPANVGVYTSANALLTTKPTGMSGNGTDALTVTYSTAAPSGAWQTTDNGTYTIKVAANTVTDNNGRGNPAMTANFMVDVPVGGPPTAAIAAPAVTAQGSAGTAVTVIYTGTLAEIDPSTIATSNITVSGPGGNLIVSAVDSTANGSSITAIYAVGAPGGSWQPADDGNYTVTVVAGSVKDLNGNAVAATNGTFNVNVIAQVSATLTSSNLYPNVGGSVTYNAILKSNTGGPVPTGTVTFLSGGTVLGMAAVQSDGSASLTIAAASQGNLVVVINYSGDDIYPPATSVASVQEAVSPPSALKASLVGALPAFVLPGQNTKLSQTVELANTTTATFGGMVNLAFYLALGTTIDSNAIPLPFSTSRTLKVAGSRQFAVRELFKQLPSTVPVGDYHLIVQLSDITGGTSVAATQGTLNVVPATIDLSGSFARVPASVKIGKTGVATIVVFNNGSVPAAGSLDLVVYASTTQTFDQSTPVARQLSKPIDIKPGKSAAIHVTGLILPSTAGSYYLVVQLDPNNVFGDVNLANNTFASATQVMVG